VETLQKMADANVATAADFARLGNLCFKQGQKDQAIKFWKRSLELDPGNQMVQRNVQLAEKQ